MEEIKKEFKKKNMSKQFMEENREAILEIYRKPHTRANRPRVLTRKERKVLGVGKDQGRASLENVRINPVKVNLLTRNIKGKSLDEAYAILEYSPRNAAPVIKQLLHSAEANAVNNNQLSRDDLYIADAFANSGPVIKRFMPRARGSATRILKRTSHITVVVKERK